MVLVFQVCLYLQGAQSHLSKRDVRPFASACASALVQGSVLTFAASVLRPEIAGFAPAALALGFLSALSLSVVRKLLPWIARHRPFLEGHLILGSGEEARKLREELDGEGVDSSKPREAVVTLRYGNLRAWALRHGVSRIVVADVPSGHDAGLAASLVECRASGLRVEQAVDSYARLRGKLWLDGVRPEWLVYAAPFSATRVYLVFKRATDVAGGLVLFLAGLPLLAIAAVAISVDSKGPVLIRQERVGLNGRRFQMVKFRSMLVDAELESGPVWCRAGDPRVTRVGRWLRKFRLDELPQLLNVLKGEMSLIGPRPERPPFVEMLTAAIPYYPLRHSIKPGISGWAQVMCPYGASIRDAQEKLEHDLYYLRHLSIALDAKIVLRTLSVVLAGRGR
jgi:exopolysaccharide biosynthesis polyprenyl glycosylphosphotransferase